MHRLLVETAELAKDVPALSRKAANHLKVLRPKDGERIELFDGKGRWRVYNYEAATKTLKSEEVRREGLEVWKFGGLGDEVEGESEEVREGRPCDGRMEKVEKVGGGGQWNCSSLEVGEKVEEESGCESCSCRKEFTTSTLKLQLLTPTRSRQARPSHNDEQFHSTTTTLHYNSVATNLTLFACVTKGSRWDWTIEKATELGVTRIVPVISARTIVRIPKDERAKKRERWMRIAEDAARQSDAKWLPEICEAVDFADSLALVRETTCFVGALTNPPPKTIGEVLGGARGIVQSAECLVQSAECGVQSATNAPSTKHQAPSTKHCSVFVGPEGDFTPEELAALLEIATPVSFGSTILRAETAAIYGISVLKSHLDAISTQSHRDTEQTLCDSVPLC